MGFLSLGLSARDLLKHPVLYHGGVRLRRSKGIMTKSLDLIMWQVLL